MADGKKITFGGAFLNYIEDNVVDNRLKIYGQIGINIDTSIADTRINGSVLLCNTSGAVLLSRPGTDIVAYSDFKFNANTDKVKWLGTTADISSDASSNLIMNSANLTVAPSLTTLNGDLLFTGTDREIQWNGGSTLIYDTNDTLFMQNIAPTKKIKLYCDDKMDLVSNSGAIEVASSGDLTLRSFGTGIVKINTNTTATNALVAVGGDLTFRGSVFSPALQVLGGVFSQTANKTVANTVTPTSIIGTGIGSLTIPANIAAVGNCINLRLQGYMDTNNSTTITFEYLYGATSMHTQVVSLAAIPANSQWTMDVMFTVRTIGLTGTVVINGQFRYDDSGVLKGSPIVKTTTSTIDTTIANLVDVKATWGTAQPDNTITTQIGSLTTRY